MKPLFTFQMPWEDDPDALYALYFYPDTLGFNFDKQQYLCEWAKLNQCIYIKIRNGNLQPTGWLGYAFERFKGWLGFRDNCHPAKVRIVASKLAYYGYLNEFNQDVTLSINKKYKLDENFLETCKKSRSNDNSYYLQQYLISMYKKDAKKLNAPGVSSLIPLPHLNPYYKFGYAYTQDTNRIIMAQLDVQDENLIKEYVLNRLPSGEFTLPNSTCRRLYVIQALENIQDSLNRRHITPQPTFPVYTLLSKIRAPIQASNNISLLDSLDKKAEEILALFPELTKQYFDLLINIKTKLAKSLGKENKIVEQRELYKNVYQLISEYCSSPKIYEYLNNYFIEDNSFATLDKQSELIQNWAKYLLQYLVNNKNLPQCNLYGYRIAQINSDLILDDSLPFFIESCLLYKDYNFALKLLEKLANLDSKQALKYLKNNHAFLYPLLATDTPLSQLYAKQLLQDAKRCWSLLSIFGTSHTYYTEAASINPNIVWQEAAPYFFEKFVKEKQWDKALSLLKFRKEANLPLDTLPLTSLNLLAKHFIDEGTRIYQEGRSCKEKNFIEAEQKYRQSLNMMEIATQIVNSDECRNELNVHRRLLAGIIIEGDEKRQCVSLERVNEAISYLEVVEMTPSNAQDEYFIPLYIKILEHRVHLLHQSCLGANVYDDVLASAEHKLHCKPSLMILMQSLDQLIYLRENKFENVDTNINNEKLAELYFLKAECISYFEVEGDAAWNYNKARELMPTHPFYHLRYASTIANGKNEKVFDLGASLLSRCGLNASQYRRWFEERWLKPEDRIYNISLPKPAVEEQNWFPKPWN